MNTPVAAVLRCFLILLLPIVAYAGSAQWNLNPISGDWNTAENWTPIAIPNGPADTATFDLSNITDVSISANTEANSIMFTPAATNPYTIIVSPGLTLTLSGTGITNNSGIQQSFSIGSTFEEMGQILFTNTSTAGDATIFNYEGGFITFVNSSTAGSSTIFDQTSQTNFFDSSTAGSATIWTDYTFVSFLDNSTAGSAFIGVTDTSHLQFAGTATAANASIGSQGFISFSEFSSADNATVTSGGNTTFYDSSTGGTAQIELLFVESYGYGGILEISSHDSPGISIGSIEGDKGTFVSLGANNLTVGSNDLSTTFAGTIYGAGSLEKIGNGVLTLGKNTYQGGTTIQAGTLLVANHRGSGTGTGPVRVTAGTLGGSGIIFNTVTVGTASGTGAFLEPSIDARKPATLSIRRALTFESDGTYTYKLITKRALADQVIANGVIIESGAQFAFRPVANKPLTIGTVFTAIDNTSANPIAGTFANITDGSTFRVGRNNYQVSYEGGDGNDLTLTVVP